MPSTALLIQQLKKAYPQFLFVESDDYLWSPSDKTVYYLPDKAGYSYILHELAHGLLDHSDYLKDIELIKMERAAWDKAITLSADHSETISDELIESNLDSYRDWIHARSTCPHCQATGLQIKKQVYACPACGHNWRVNEARICALRRFSL